MRFGLYVNPTRDPGLTVTRKLIASMLARRVTPVIEEEYAYGLTKEDGIVVDSYVSCRLLI